jgi:hypothetical protein
MSYQYNSVELGETPSDESAVELTVSELGGDVCGVRASSIRKGLGPMVVALLLVGALAALMTYSSSAGAEANATSMSTNPLVLGMAKGETRACAFDECYEANCNAKVAPFICLRNNGGPHMGW